MPALTIQQAFELAVGYHESGRAAEAESIYRQILSLQPDHAQTLRRMGLLILQQGRRDEALALIERAVRAEPQEADHHSALGIVHGARGRLAEAVEALQKAVALRPNEPSLLNNLATALFRRGQLAESIEALRGAVALKPGFPEGWYNLGKSLQQSGDLEAAEAAYRRAVELRPSFVAAINNLGNVLAERDQYDAAIAAFGQALALRPNWPEAFYNIGNAYKSRGKPAEAADAYRRALALRPDYPEVYNNLGNLHRDANRMDDAIAAFRQALSLRPDNPDARWNLGLALLSLGEFTEGWAAFEARWQIRASAARAFDKPPWDGSPLAGRRILLHAEQGLGDTIQFIRFAPLVVQRGGHVIAQVPPEVRRLLEGQCGIEQVVSTSDALPDFDVHCPLLGLPRIFATTFETLPGATPYLSAKPSQIEQWRARLSREPGRLKVGLNWAGNPLPRNNRKRTIGLAAMAPVATVSDVRFISLQKGQGAADLATPPGGMDIVDWTAELSDLADTAALMSGLDLIITCDTSVAHLAGALGRPVWVALPFAADWRWFLDRDDSPWYPTMRLFRQAQPGDWAAPIQRIARELHALAAGG